MPHATAAITIALFAITTTLATITTRTPTITEQPAPEPTCTVELRSWIVVGWARHLYIDITCPPNHDQLNGRVEFTSALLTFDYDNTRNTALDAPPLVRYSRRGRLSPPDFAPAPDNRPEQTYEVTLEQANCLQQDRLFPVPYILTETNSNSGIRVTLQDCGCELPQRILDAGTPLGEFPGIDHDTGQPVPPEDWPAFGFRTRPSPIPAR